MLKCDSCVFQSFCGRPLITSRITPLFRHALKNLGIFCEATVTDFRKASVSLIAKFCTNLHELMAQFFCHSKIVHERNYKIQVGHSGLIRAFKALEKMQTSPFSSINEIDSLRELYQLSPMIYFQEMDSLLSNSSSVQDSSLAEESDSICSQLVGPLPLHHNTTSTLQSSALYDVAVDTRETARKATSDDPCISCSSDSSTNASVSTTVTISVNDVDHLVEHLPSCFLRHVFHV